MRVRFFVRLHVPSSRQFRGRTERTAYLRLVAARGKLVERKKKSCSSRAPGGLSAPLPTRAWKPAELITSAPLLVLRGAKEDGK